jgi:Amt family ammonium transporter
MRGYSIPFAVLGTFILWFGWWGFNGGSTLKVGSDVGLVILNTNIAAAAGGFTAFVHCWFVQDKQDINEKFIGGILGGLVAITACADIMDIGRALLIGLAAGVLHNLSYDVLLKKMRVDDPVGAVPVHLVCGIFGTMCVAVADPDILGRSNAQQFGIQMFGIAACMVWSVGCSLVMFVGLKTIIGLRVSPEEEVAGLNMEGETDDEIPADELEVDPEVIRRLMID